MNQPLEAQASPSKLRIVAGGAVLMMLGWVVFDMATGSNDAAPLGPPISVSAIHLTGDFSENPVAAGHKYGNYIHR
jgi:hypothetical protein